MKIIKLSFVLAALSLSLSSNVQAQVLTDITANIGQFFFTAPGISCKTRTNNDASVRNLAHGVWNRDSNTPVALNCGLSLGAAWGTNFGSLGSTRVSGDINVNFVRYAGTSLAAANQAFCAFSLSDDDTTDPTPNTQFSLGSAMASFTGAVGTAENDEPSISTSIPFNSPNGSQFNFISAFCLLPRGVRLQQFAFVPITLRSD